jgi:hypothetical protein
VLDINIHRLLALFGDAQEHSFFEIVTLGKILLKISDRRVEALFKKSLLDNGWVKRCGKSWAEHLDFYQLTPKGDEFFRHIQVWRITRGRHTEDQIRHFRKFNRQTKGEYGVEGMGDNLTEQKAGLYESHSHLYG